MDPTVWITLVTTLFAEIKKCKEAKQKPEVIAESLRNPRGRTLVKVERATRLAHGMSPRQWRKNPQAPPLVAEAVAELRALTPQEAMELVEEADGGEEVGASDAQAWPLAGYPVGPQPAAFTIPPVDIAAVTDIATKVEAARKALSELVGALGAAGKTIPGLGSLLG